MVLLNKSEGAVEVTLRENGLGGQLVLQPHTITTVCYGAKFYKSQSYRNKKRTPF